MKLCKCGCNTEIADDKTWVKGHNTIIMKQMSTPEARKKLSIAGFNRTTSEETKARQRQSVLTSEGHIKQIGGQDIVKHHYIYDESDLSLYTTKMTRSKHSIIHAAMRKEGITVPHINIMEGE